MVSMLSKFGPMMPPGSACVSLTYLASEKVVPGYGGGQSCLPALPPNDHSTLILPSLPATTPLL